MPRKACKFPDDCGGGKAGRCRKCGDPLSAASRKKLSDGMKARRSAPDFEVKRAEASRWRGKRVYAAHVKAAATARLFKPDVVEKKKAAVVTANDRRRGYALPPGTLKTVRKWRRHGLTADQIRSELAHIIARATDVVEKPEML